MKSTRQSDPTPPDEREARRLEALLEYAMLDTLPEKALDDLTALAAQICEAPIALISLVDEKRQWFKARVGIEIAETPRDVAFCDHTIRRQDLFIVPNALEDERFANFPLVTGETGVRFYAGAPLIDSKGAVLGALCVMDRVPRTLPPAQEQALRVLARQVTTHLELHRHTLDLVVNRDQLRQREEQLQWKTAFFEAQLNSSPDGILVVDGNARKIIQNERMVELWKIPREFADEKDDKRQFEWAAQQLKDPTHFVEKSNYLQSHRDEISRDELEFIDGRIIDRYSAPVRGQDGKYYGRIWTFRDITEQKKAVVELRESEKKFRHVFQKMQIGVVIHEPDTTIAFSNMMASQLLGLTTEQLRGKSAIDPVWHFIREDGTRMPEAEYPVKRALQADDEFETGLILGICRPDREKPVWVLCHALATRNKDGQIQQVIVSFLDITERKEAESRLRLQSSALEAAANAIVITDAKGAIVWANHAFTANTGYSVSEVTGKNPNLLKSGKQNAEFYQKLWETISLGKVWHGELTNRRKDGTLYEEEMTITPIKNVAGEIEHFIAVKQDITERKKLETQFMRAQRMESIGTLAGGIAHDLNNILAPILMSIEILKTTSDNSQTKMILETVETSAKRGADIVRQVLSFARGLEGERIEVQPKHLLKDLENIIRDTFPKNIRLQFSIPKDIWTILGDPTQIHQILLNLCVNARDAMPSGGNLIISVENTVLDEQYSTMNLQTKPGRYVCIKVIDSGTGIPPEILDKIFEPFFTTKEINRGTGLGLSTVMAIVKSHEGTVNVNSDPGRGTTFKVHLPAMEMSAEGRKEQAEQPSLPRGNNEAILVVDDEPSILTITGQTLWAFGYRVLTASNGAEAVAVYAQRSTEISVVLTDMMMPIMDGPATIHALMLINPSVKIIAASGLNANFGVAKATNAGVKHFLTKPYTAATLLKTLRSIINPS